MPGLILWYVPSQPFHFHMPYLLMNTNSGALGCTKVAQELMCVSLCMTVDVDLVMKCFLLRLQIVVDDHVYVSSYLY